MVQWGKLFNWKDNGDLQYLRDQSRRLLPENNANVLSSALDPKLVTKTALRLQHQVETVIPCEIEEQKITRANSPVITRRVIATAKSAAGEDRNDAACVIFALLVVNRWFRRRAVLELWDADLHNARATGCEMIAKHIIEAEEDMDYLLQDMLLKKYSIVIKGQETEPANAIERAVDLHCLRVIGSSGYQKCIAYLWKGWLVQDDSTPSRFVRWEQKASTKYTDHLDPDRMRAPQYQNAVQIFFSILYLALYTAAINTINNAGDLDVVEGILYLFTAGFLFDELSKFWKVGRYYLGFWNVFNLTLYALLTTSFITRMIALSHPEHTDLRIRFNVLSYNFLAFSAPMFWMRLLLYLDTFRFFGAMLVVLKVMMKESLIFFALLLIVCVGFLQAFIGMDQVDDNTKVTSFIVQAMANSVMQSPDFGGFENFAPPFGIILYYIFTFVVMVVLLNILIALYNSAYEDITDNAIDEYMALFSLKTMQFVRAPDENVFIAPFNLIEVFCLILPFEWWLPTERYERLNNAVMATLYSPLLLITAYIETKQAAHVKHNRRKGQEDDDVVEEWEQMMGEVDLEEGGWAKTCEETKPNVETDAAVLEVRELRREVEDLRKRVEEQMKIGDGKAAGDENGA